MNVFVNRHRICRIYAYQHSDYGTVVVHDFYSKYHYFIMVQILSVVLNAGRTKVFDSLR